MKGALSHKQELLYGALVRAAASGARCPSNPEICEIVGVGSVSWGATEIARLEARGLISVTRFQTGREVTIVATGKSTARMGGTRKAHWRDRGVVRKVAHVATETARVRPDDEHLPAAVFRDPCPRCGTRGDVGCGHSGTRLAIGMTL